MQNNIQYYTILDTFQKHNGVRNYTFYLCECICGVTKEIRVFDYKNNKVVSCGCMTENALIKEIPSGTRYGYLVVNKRNKEKSTEGYKYECVCDCGKIINVYYNRLKRGETKSCGCSSSKLNSLNNGGTGIPYETATVRMAIRLCPTYKRFVKKCLARAKGKSELSGELSKTLCVHHLDSVSVLIQKYNLTISNFLTCKELFSLNNAIVLTEEEHHNFHRQYNRKCTKADWESYKQTCN
jgi:hypothetical protein